MQQVHCFFLPFIVAKQEKVVLPVTELRVTVVES